MTTINGFQLAAACVVGTEHLRLKKNNQDAYAVVSGYIKDQPALVGVVCDGCGSEATSEVGSKLAAPMLASAILKYCGVTHGDFTRGIALAEADVLADLRKLASNWVSGTPGWTKSVSQNFLFTIIGFIITPETTYIFSLGDGVYCINGELTVIEFPNNKPPYLGYQLISSDYDSCHITINEQFPTDELSSLVVGSDGVAQLASLAETPYPGKDKLIGPLSQFWEQDCYYKNPDKLRRTLALINREAVRPDWEKRVLNRHPGLLEDDTTLLVVRRPPNVEE